MFRKPSKYLFNLALKKARLDPSEVWFCGENIKADVVGAANAEIFPIWYDNLTIENPFNANNDVVPPEIEHLHIHDWNELIEALEENYD